MAIIGWTVPTRNAGACPPWPGPPTPRWAPTSRIARLGSFGVLYYDQPITKKGLAQTGDFRHLDADEPYPGVRRRSFSTPRSTVTFYEFMPRAVFPRHRHPQEQITLVQRGEVRFTLGEDVQHLRSAGWSVVPPELEHGLEAGADGAEVLAIVSPPREHLAAYTVVEETQRA